MGFWCGRCAEDFENTTQAPNVVDGVPGTKLLIKNKHVVCAWGDVLGTETYGVTKNVL